MLIIKRPWTRQPQGVVAPSNRLPPPALLALPGLNARNYATGEMATIVAPASINTALITPDGVSRLFHPGGATAGEGGRYYSRRSIPTGDFTAFWVGVPLNLASSSLMLGFGADTDSGWGFYSLFPDSTSINFSLVTTTPVVGETLLLTGISLESGRAERIAFKRSGTAMSIYFHRTRTSASKTVGSGMRSADSNGTFGWSIALGYGGGVAGHIQTTMGAAYPTALTDDVVWSVLDNPWQVFQPRRIYIPTASAAAFPTLSNATATAITTTGFRPRVTAG